MVVNRANGSRVTVYIRSIAAYKHIPWVCAMLANNTYNLPVAFISARSMAWRGNNRGNKSTKHGTQVAQSLPNTHHVWSKEHNDGTKHCFALPFVTEWNHCGAPARTTASGVAGYNDPCYVQPCRRIACARMRRSCRSLAKHSSLDASFLDQNVLRAEQLTGRGRLPNEYKNF